MTPTELVYAMMEKVGWSQAKLSRELGYKSPGTMSNRLKRGNMGVTTLHEMAEVMGYEIVVRSKWDPATEFVVTADKE